MWELIKYEYKKILKDKVNIILVVTSLFICLFMMNSHIMNNFDSTRNFENENGEVLENIDLYRYIDNFQREHAGEITPEFVAKMKQTFDELLSKYSKEYDDEWMKQHFGENYLELVQRMKENSISEEELFVQLPNNENDFLPYKQNGEWKFLEKYANQGYKQLLWRCTEYLELDSYLQLSNFEINEEMLKKPEMIENELHFSGVINTLNTWNNASEKEIDYVNQIIKETSFRFDSTVGAEILRRLVASNEMQVTYMLLLIVVALLISNIFSYENKVEPILYTSKYGYKKTTFAKLITTCLIALGIPLIYFVISIIYTRSIVPIDHLDLAIRGYEFKFQSYQSYIASSMCVIIMASLAVAVSTYFISCLTKNRAGTFVLFIIINAVMFNLSFELNILFKDLVLNMHINPFNLNPFAMVVVEDFIGMFKSELNVGTILNYSNLNGSIIHTSFVYELIWLVTISCLSITCYFKQKRHIVR